MLGGKSWEHWIAQYSLSHQHPVNRVCHTLGIPLIVLSLPLFLVALVASGPYAVLRNPMYLGAAAAMGGAALYYQSWGLLTYVIALVIAAHLFVVAYEEPTLRRVFGRDYDSYCARTRRWGIV